MIIIDSQYLTLFYFAERIDYLTVLAETDPFAAMPHDASGLIH
jgi:hypothetical protein